MQCEPDGRASDPRRSFALPLGPWRFHVILRPGDEVAIIAPAASSTEPEASLIDRAVEVLEEWGLRVRVRAERTRHYYLAGTDNVRAAHLYDALADPTTRAIFAARGGYGTMRLFPHLNRHIKPAQKFLVGYSDVTALHLAAAALWPELKLIHGPNVATNQFLGPEPTAEANRNALRSALFDPGYAVDLPVEFLRPGQASGRLHGGCLSLLAATLGSPFAPVLRGAILLLEDTDEAPYRIDRLLIQLRNAGLFAGVAGVVFGVMQDCSDGINDLRRIILDVMADQEFPIAFGLKAGHGETNVALPLGAWVRLDSRAGRFRLLPEAMT